MKKHMLGPTCDTCSAGDTTSGQSSAFRSSSTTQKKDRLWMDNPGSLVISAMYRMLCSDTVQHSMQGAFERGQRTGI